MKCPKCGQKRKRMDAKLFIEQNKQCKLCYLGIDGSKSRSRFE